MGSYVEGGEVFDQQIHIIQIPEHVRQRGIATPEIIAEGAAFLHKDGVVILDNAIDIAHVDILNGKLSPEALEIANDPDHHFNFGKKTRNMDQAPPPTREFMFKDVWCNPFAAAVLAAVLGPKPVIHYANGNTALKAEPDGRQPVHSDCDFEHPAYFPFAYAININLVDTTPENGGTEIWVGSHHVSRHESHISATSCESDEHALQIKSELVEERRKHSPPVQITSKKGSLIIRDLRLWHAGRPNLTDTPRIMLAFVAQPAWFQGRSKVLLPISVREFVESWNDEFQFSVEWLDGDVDYKHLSSVNVDFDTNSVALKKHRQKLSEWPVYIPRWN